MVSQLLKQVDEELDMSLKDLFAGTPAARAARIA
jgi:hypothetical protein